MSSLPTGHSKFSSTCMHVTCHEQMFHHTAVHCYNYGQPWTAAVFFTHYIFVHAHSAHVLTNVLSGANIKSLT